VVVAAVWAMPWVKTFPTLISPRRNSRKLVRRFGNLACPACGALLAGGVCVRVCWPCSFSLLCMLM
jgi:hypothetical protein